MVSREHKRAAMFKKLRLLRSITNSHAKSKTSVILDASKYIEKLKQEVERLNQDIATAKNSISQNPFPVVKVEAQEEGFLINVISERSCTGLLSYILEAFEEVGLDVLQARVCCSDKFHLEAVGGYENQGETESIDAQGVRQAVIKAIQNWTEK